MVSKLVGNKPLCGGILWPIDIVCDSPRADFIFAINEGAENSKKCAVKNVWRIVPAALAAWCCGVGHDWLRHYGAVNDRYAINHGGKPASIPGNCSGGAVARAGYVCTVVFHGAFNPPLHGAPRDLMRSEERRVGKECRSRGL